jgi:hypothetical protein
VAGKGLRVDHLGQQAQPEPEQLVGVDYLNRCSRYLDGKWATPARNGLKGFGMAERPQSSDRTSSRIGSAPGSLNEAATEDASQQGWSC